VKTKKNWLKKESVRARTDFPGQRTAKKKSPADITSLEKRFMKERDGEKDEPTKKELTRRQGRKRTRVRIGKGKLLVGENGGRVPVAFR